MSAIERGKELARSLARAVGYEITRSDDTGTMAGALRRLAARRPEIRTIVDVGASDGRWSLAARRVYPRASFLLFEALEDPHGPALRRLAAESGMHIVVAAAGDRPGEIHFDAGDAFGGAASRAATGDHDLVVPMSTIDDEVSRLGLPGPYLLKLDTHGFEVPILEGARETLDRTEAVVIEVYNFPIHPDALMFPEMCRWLEARGFRVVDLVDVMRRPGDAALWQFDLVLVRATGPEFASNRYGDPTGSG